MKKLILKDVQGFNDLISASTKLLTEANIAITPSGVELISMDAANVAMVVFKMSAVEFKDYAVSEGEVFGVNLKNFKQVLSRGGKDSETTITFDEKVIVSFSGKAKKEFTLPLLDLDTGRSPKKMPNLNFAVEVTIDDAELRDVVADASLASESCVFEVQNGRFVVSGSGDLNKVVSETNGVVSYAGDVKTSRNTYSIEYLNNMLGSRISKTVKLGLGNDYPVKLTYTNQNATLILTYILAPRISND